MIRLKKIGHVNLGVADIKRSKTFYCDVLGFRVAEEDPDHGGVFMTLGDELAVTRAGEPLPAWLSERWPVEG